MKLSGSADDVSSAAAGLLDQAHAFSVEAPRSSHTDESWIAAARNVVAPVIAFTSSA